MNKSNNMLSLIASFVKHSIRWIISTIVICIVFILGMIITLILTNSNRNEQEIEIEETPIEIVSILPRGEIVVCSSMIEDYATKRKTESLFGIKTEHVCAQILRQKCCYKINLDKIEYSAADSKNTVHVKLPEPEYHAYTLSSDFMSDDDEFWAKELPSTNDLKSKVSKQIEARFCTSSNKHKAEMYAEEVVVQVLKSFGYEVEFARTIESTKD